VIFLSGDLQLCEGARIAASPSCQASSTLAASRSSITHHRDLRGDADRATGRYSIGIGERQCCGLCPNRSAMTATHNVMLSFKGEPCLPVACLHRNR
jgi:hypothetical protein